MDIEPSHLKAFLEVVRCGSISQAARKLHVTQPAISLRLQLLENALGVRLFVRGKAGSKLTDAGHQLLKYSNIQKSLEEELLATFLKRAPGSLKGQLVIAGHFSIVNHVAVPAIAEVLMKNPEVIIRTIVKEDDELPPLLARGDADFVFLQKELKMRGFVSHYLGSEEYVLVEPKKGKVVENRYIDSDPSDTITEDFFKIQSRAPATYSRCFLHNEAGILRGVMAGIGKAIIARNEIPSNCPVRIVKGNRPLKIPAYLHHSEQPYFTQLQLASREALLKNCPKLLVP